MYKGLCTPFLAIKFRTFPHFYADRSHGIDSSTVHNI